MRVLGGLLKPIWARYEKVIELEREIDIIAEYVADEMLELKEQLADARSKNFMLQRSIDYLKIKMKEGKNV